MLVLSVTRTLFDSCLGVSKLLQACPLTLGPRYISELVGLRTLLLTPVLANENAARMEAAVEGDGS